MQASEREIIWVMRVAIFGVGALATAMGITIDTIYGLWYLCADLVYVILFPQLVCVVYLPGTNTYGSLFGYTIGFLFRLLGGEPLIGMPAVIKFPFYDEVDSVQRFPFKTVCMILSFSLIVSVSYVMKYIFENDKLPKEYDLFECIVNIPNEVVALQEASTPDNGESFVGELTTINPKKGDGKGEINPSLKFSKEELLLPGGAAENKAMDVSPCSEDARGKPPRYSEY